MAFQYKNGGKMAMAKCEWKNHSVPKSDLKYYKNEHFDGNYCSQCQLLVKKCGEAIDLDDQMEKTFGSDSLVYKDFVMNALRKAMIDGGDAR